MISADHWNVMQNLSTEAPNREMVIGFIIGYLAVMILFQLWQLYTEWALEMERQKARIFFEEKYRAKSTNAESSNILTLEGRTSKASS